MATDVERLVLELSANVTSMEKQLARAQNTANRTASNIEKRFDKMGINVNQSFAGIDRALRVGFAGIGVGLVVKSAADAADAWTKVGNAIALAGVAADQILPTQKKLADIAVDTRSTLQSTAELYARIFRVRKEVGATEEQILKATELVNKALAGADESERAAAVVQLGQGLSSARLQGDELKSILENSRPLAEAIAKEFGVAVGDLRKLGRDGELVSSRVFKAILKAGPEIEGAYSKTTETIAAAFTNLQTRVIEYIGTTKSATNASRLLAQTVEFVADNFHAFADAAILAAAVLGGAFAGVAVARMVIALRTLIVTLIATEGALTASGVAAGLATRAFAVMEATIAAMGGPLGIILAALGAGMAYLALQAQEVTASYEETQRVTGSMKSVLDAYRDSVFNTIAAHGDERRELEKISKSRYDAAKAALQQAKAEAEATRALGLSKLQAARKEFFSSEDFHKEPKAEDFGRIGKSLLSTIPGSKENKRLEELKELLAKYLGAQEAIKNLEGQIEDLADLQVSGGKGAGSGTSKSGRTVADLEQAHRIEIARLLGREEEAHYAEQIEEVTKRTNAYEDAGLSKTKAKEKALQEVADINAAILGQQYRALDAIDLEQQASLARAKGEDAVADAIESQIELLALAARLESEGGLSRENALLAAKGYVDQLKTANEEVRIHNSLLHDLELQQQIAQARGDERAAAAIGSAIDLQNRIEALQRLGRDPDQAAREARAEVDALRGAGFEGQLSEFFSGAFKAAFDGDLQDYFKNWLGEALQKAFNDTLNSIAHILYEVFKNAWSSAGDGQGGGAGSLIDAGISAFSRGLGGPMSPGIAYRVHKDEDIVPMTSSYAIPAKSRGVTLALNYHSNVNAAGADPATVDRLARAQAQDRADLEGRVRFIVGDLVSRNRLR